VLRTAESSWCSGSSRSRALGSVGKWTEREPELLDVRSLTVENQKLFHQAARMAGERVFSHESVEGPTWMRECCLGADIVIESIAFIRSMHDERAPC
jgi:hypothetical protein